MSFKSIFALSALALVATATPWGKTTTSCDETTSSSWGKTTPTPTPTWVTSTTPASAPAPTATGSGFLATCQNFGLSLLDCTELGSISALNGNTIVIGGPAPSSSSTPVNNGGEFMAACENYGLSVADCAQLLNLSILDGNTVDISLADLTSLVSALGLSSLLPSLVGTLVGGGLVPLVTGIL